MIAYILLSLFHTNEPFYCVKSPTIVCYVGPVTAAENEMLETLGKASFVIGHGDDNSLSDYGHAHYFSYSSVQNRASGILRTR